MQKKISAFLGESYNLVDTGGFMKLERFGDKLIARPSSLCMWKKMSDKSEWANADATYDPKDGWKFKGKNSFNEWLLPCQDFKLKLRLQSNGQVGIFPEHAYYLDQVRKFLANKKDSSTKVLNLFAYSGMATVTCMKEGAEVCHVDSSKKALDWAKDNIKLNGLNESKLRLIPDDALGFLKRESRRESKYDLVIMDPPSFSRLDGKKSWKLEEVIYEFISSAISILNSTGMLVLSCHHHALDSRMLCNILKSEIPIDLKIVDSKDLGIEESTGRQLPAGCVTILSY